MPIVVLRIVYIQSNMKGAYYHEQESKPGEYLTCDYLRRGFYRRIFMWPRREFFWRSELE